MEQQSQQLTEEEELYARAAFGKNIEAFWDSDVGKYLHTRAQECYTAAVERLKSVDAEDAKAIRNAQNDVHVAEWFTQWLQQGVQDGLRALQLVQGELDEVSQE